MRPCGRSICDVTDRVEGENINSENFPKFCRKMVAAKTMWLAWSTHSVAYGRDNEDIRLQRANAGEIEMMTKDGPIWMLIRIEPLGHLSAPSHRPSYFILASFVFFASSWIFETHPKNPVQWAALPTADSNKSTHCDGPFCSRNDSRLKSYKDVRNTTEFRRNALEVSSEIERCALNVIVAWFFVLCFRFNRFQFSVYFWINFLAAHSRLCSRRSRPYSPTLQL